MPGRFILSVKFSHASSPALGRRAVGAFLRYVQYRDQHLEAGVEDHSPTDGLLRYVAYRDRTSKRGELFGPHGRAGDIERRELGAHVARSLVGAKAGSAKPPRSVYRFVLSPEHARGLDLPELARSAMRQLEEDCGPLPPWVAAVHRNTGHPHVHIVLAARREVAPGSFKGLTITRDRLARMKGAIGIELSQEMGEHDRTRSGAQHPRQFVRRSEKVSTRWSLSQIHRVLVVLDASRPLLRLARYFRKMERLRQTEEELRRRRERELELERGRS